MTTNLRSSSTDSSQSVPPELLTVLQREAVKRELTRSPISFTKHFFGVRKERFIEAEFHALIEDALLKVERGEIKNLLITIAPRHGKTQIAVIDWMARCVGTNPRAKFIHLSYSDQLALDNSSKTRELVNSAEYQEMWPVTIKPDADSKKLWYTEQGGGVYATAAGGPITGFGAGVLDDPQDGKFYGAIIIDDPIKVDDAYNENERLKVNQRLNGTIKSRRNSRNTPIIIIMQRLHEDDMAGFVLAGGMDEEFYHLNLPAVKDFGITKAADGKFALEGVPLWPYKHTLEELESMMRADHQVFMAQYMQNPAPDEGTYFKKEWFEAGRFRLGEQPTRLVTYGAGDYAVSDTKDADYTEQAIGGFDEKDDLWFLGWSSGKDTLDKSIDKMMIMVLDHDPMLWAMESGVIRRAMEPFVVKEQLARRCFFKLEFLPANKSKAANAKSFQALCSQGKVHIPFGIWGDALIAQLLKFTGRDDKEDDKVDVCGIFGRILDQAFGPSVYQAEEKQRTSSNDDYGVADDDDEPSDWKTA